MTKTTQVNKLADEEKEYYSLVKRAFEALAPFYDIVTKPIASVRNRVVEFANAGKGSKILDVATGTGKQAFAFARNGYEVIGVDLSEAMLKVAQRNNKYRNAKFEVADATHLRFNDDSFDVSCISLALHDMPQTIREKILKEMVRVTKPSGLIMVVDYGLPENRIRRFFIYHLIRLYEGKYYLEFIKLNLRAFLGKSGVKIIGELPVLLGAGRILKGINLKGGDKNG